MKEMNAGVGLLYFIERDIPMSLGDSIEARCVDKDDPGAHLILV